MWSPAPPQSAGNSGSEQLGGTVYTGVVCGLDKKSYHVFEMREAQTHLTAMFNV